MFVQRLAVLVLLAIPAKACDGILRQTDKGLICGVSLPTGGANFLGIPFAAPPVGDLRWAPPAEPAAWGNKTLNVFDYGPGCPQLHHNPDVPEPQDEDCLSLSVYEPPASCGKELPVMIWFHGGSFEEGGSSLFFYNGTNLASRQCVVVVAGNYRIGAFGAVLTDDLGGNQQLQDQRAVMKWVQKNAASFQGDPSKVTIFGQSAGAMSIGFHLSSPAAAGLFHNAILQSAPNGYPYKDRKQALQYGRMFAKELGCGDGFKADVSCMRSKNTTEVLHAQKAVESKVPGILKIIVEWHSLACLLPFTPSVLENDEFPLQPLEAIKTGKYNKVPLLLGTNAGDAILFVGCGKGNVSATEYTAGIDLAFGSHGHAVNKAYPATKGADAKPVLSHMTTDFFFRCPSRALATGASENTPVFMYEFDHALPFNIFNKSCCDNQACHGEEIPLVFDALGIYHLDKASAALGDTIMHMWGNFARSGNPNGDTLPIWPAFNKTAAMRLVLQTPEPKAESTLGGVCDDLWDKFVPFWDRPQGP